ncbi:MAG: glycosyltransferase family 4 protein [Anaerolineaceae bacterium]|nr:glycosyltransferase family 4 protein [Anaerolineaceae bacterium]
MAPMPHVLLISRCPPWPLHLGDRLIVWHLARELSRRGCVIDLLAFTDQREDHDDVEHYRAHFGEVALFDETARPPSTLLRRLLLPGSRFPVRAAGVSSPAMWRAIEQRVAVNDYDCAHFFGGIQVSEYRHAVGELPTLITPYESYSLYMRRALEASSGPAPAIRLRHFLARRFESWMYVPFGRRVVVSDRDRAELRRLNPSLDWEVIPNGVDAEHFRPSGDAREAASLLFTGNFAYEPNVDAALWLARDLVPRLRQEHPELQLWLVGNAPPESLRTLDGEGIRVTGRVPDLRPWLTRATLYVSPLRMGAGIKNKVLEALATGCPLLATPLSAEGIALEHGRHAWLAERSDFPAAASKLLADVALRERLALAGRQLVESRYSWRQVAERYAALYQMLASPVRSR